MLSRNKSRYLAGYLGRFPLTEEIRLKTNRESNLRASFKSFLLTLCSMIRFRTIRVFVRE